MLLAYLLLITGLTISAVAIYYSVVGLAAIFSAAVIPIVIMGSSLEVAKLVCASWLKANWDRVPRLMKIYMTTAVVILMLITSMGIFGFLSKAHNDQNLVSGDVQSKIAIYDEKIKTAKENIEAARKQLKQMDEAVDQIMGRSTDEKGADKANAVRKSQLRDRSALAKEIETNQRLIASLNDEAAPIRAEVRKVEAEVGPIKYIAKFIYGESGADENMLEKAVTWIIIIIVTVFDPLAVIMLLGAQMTFGWHNKGHDPLAEKKEEEPVPEDDEFKFLADEQDLYPEENLEDRPIPKFLLKTEEETKVSQDPHPVGWAFPKRADLTQYQVVGDADDEEPVATPTEEVPVKEIEIISHSHMLIDGERVAFNDLKGNDDTLTSTVDLAKKLEKTGEYKITHTADGIILTDEEGKSSEHALDERPGDYVTPTYVQNEEQKEGGLWQKIQHTISEEEYIKKSEENKKGNV